MKNKTLKYKGYEGSIEPSVEDGCLFGRVLFIVDRIIYDGNTLPELEEAFHELVDDYLETCEELGKDPNKPCSGQFQVRITPEMHRDVVRAAYKSGMSMNEFFKTAVAEKLEKQTAVRHVHEHKHTIVEVDQEFSFDTLQEMDEWQTREPVPVSH